MTRKPIWADLPVPGIPKATKVRKLRAAEAKFPKRDKPKKNNQHDSPEALVETTAVAEVNPKPNGHQEFTDEHEPQSLLGDQAAKIDIARHLFDIPDDKFSQRTRTTPGMLTTLVLQEVFDALANPRESRDATELFRLYFDRRSLSLKGQSRWEGLKLAETKTEEEKNVGDILGI